MKNRALIILLILVAGFFTSCNKEDDSTQMETLNGTWNLQNISGGIIGINEEFENGIITWTFNNQNSTLNVENNSSQENVYSGYESGIYGYSIIQNNGSDYLLIDTAEYGRYIISDKSLIINQNEISSGSGNDGFLLQFNR